MLFFVDQHGCAKNQVDAEILIGILVSKGWERTSVPEDAKLILINSCGFIESAKKESLEAVLTARAAYPNAKIVLAGCLAERYASDFAESLPEADAFFGNGDLSRLPELLDTLFTGDSHPVITPAQEGVCGGNRPELLSFPRSAYVKITEGCDNCCSFCAIPLIRGRLRSRSVQSIVEECTQLVKRGIWEINLIGQDLAAFGSGASDATVSTADIPDTSSDPLDRPSPLARPNPLARPTKLAILLSAISAIPGDFRVRLLYIHPDHFPRDILPVMTSDPRFFPYFDIPFQSGDERILKDMNRKGNAETYKTLVRDIRAAFAQKDNPYGTIALRTTILTGFPGETDESFETTARFLADIRSMWSGSFTWSPEEGTKAVELKKKVTKKKAKERQEMLQAIQTRITPEELSFFLGRTVEVLVEEVIPRQPASEDENGLPSDRLALGRAWFQAPEVDGSVVLQFEDGQKDLGGKAIESGSIVTATVKAVNGVDVEAVVT